MPTDKVFKLELNDKHTIEFYVCDTNELNPYRKTKEMAVVVLGKDFQKDGMLDRKEMKVLIKFLSNSRKEIKKFNKK